MPSANPISDRTERFLNATVQQVGEDARQHVSNKQVCIALDPTVAETLTGQLILFTLLNLLLRLDIYCPRIAVSLPEVSRHPLLRLLGSRDLLSGLDSFFTPFPSKERVFLRSAPFDETSNDISIAISPQRDGGRLSIWADGWIVYFNADAPVDAIRDNAVGACVAAAFGASEIFKHLVSGLPLRPGMAVRPAERIVFSTYDYTLTAGDNPPLPATVTLDDTVIVGLGGIGSAFVAAMSSLPAIAGDIALVDHDALDETNLNRFLIARPGDAGLKVELCQRALAFHPGIQIYPEEFETFIKGQTSNHSSAVVGVDKDRVRRAIQSAMPRLIFNAGTSDLGSFRVTRHDYVHGACLSCISRDDLDSHSVERELSRRLGIDLQTVLDYQKTGQPLPIELLAKSGALNPTAVAELSNHSIAEIQQRLCGQVALGADHSEPAMSISFLSALPGFLLLGELIKEQNYPQLVRPPLNAQVNHAFFSVLGRLHPKLLHGWREKQEDCDCRRAAYQRAHARKWG